MCGMRAAGFTALLAATLLAGSPGIRSRSAATDYPARHAGADLAVGAAVVPHNELRKIFAADLNGAGYIAIEVGVFPAPGHEIDLSPADFTLRTESGKIAARPVDADTIAAAIAGKRESPRVTRQPDIYATAGVW